MDSRELLRRYYDLLNEGKFEDAAGMFRTEGEIIWSIPGRGKLAGKYESKAAIRDALELFHDGSFGTIMRPMHAICIAEDDEHVCAQYLLRMVRGEEVCDVVAIDAWHVDGEHLAEVWTFFETLYEFDAWTG